MKEVNFLDIKSVAVKNVQTQEDANCSPEFKSFGILILSITVDAESPFLYKQIDISSNSKTG